MTINRNQGPRHVRKTIKTPLLGQRCFCVATLCGALMLSGCTSTSTIDTAFSDIAQPATTEPLPPPAEPAPVAAAQSVTNEDVPRLALTEPAVSAGPLDTGTFPNLNDEPEATLRAEADNAALLAEMQALAAAQAAGRVSADAYRARMAQLQRLAATHSAETLRQIEGQ